jgi:hypothetical protein
MLKAKRNTMKTKSSTICPYSSTSMLVHTTHLSPSIQELAGPSRGLHHLLLRRLLHRRALKRDYPIQV